MSLGSAKPLVATTGWAIGSYVAAAGLQLRATGNMEVSLRALVICLAGALYTNLFEHIWHRHAMHGRRPDPRHATHHRLFYGERFQTSDPAALGEIVTGWYIFPLLLTVHYAAFILLFRVRTRARLLSGSCAALPYLRGHALVHARSQQWL